MNLWQHNCRNWQCRACESVPLEPGSFGSQNLGQESASLYELAREERDAWEWMRKGLCQNYPADLWYREAHDEVPEGIEGRNTTEASRNICGMCQVQQECLKYALANREAEGMWGGWTSMERREWLGLPRKYKCGNQGRWEESE